MQNVSLIFELFFNGKDGFDGHWEDYKYQVAGLWCWKGWTMSEPGHLFI